MILNRITKFNAPLARKEFSTWRGLEKDLKFSIDKKTTANLLSQDGVTFTRASLAYNNNSSGNLVSVASGEPGYEYSGATSLGLRIEKGSTNKIVNTVMDECATSGKLWTTADAATLGVETDVSSPDGGTNGISMSGWGGTHVVETPPTKFHIVYDTTNVAASGAFGGWSASVYAKAGNVPYFGFAFCNTVKIGAAFNLSDGSIVNSYNCTASIEDVGDGWYRCKCENLQNVASYMVFAFTCSKTTGGVWNDSGLGAWYSRAESFSTSGSFPSVTHVANHVFLFGPQFEDSTFCTSYMANPSELTAGVARAADIATITGSNFSSFYNASEGTFAVEGTRTTAGSSALPTLMEVNDGGTSDTIGFNTSATKEQFDIYGPSGAATIETVNDIAKHTAIKVAGAYKANKYAASGSSSTVAVNTLAAVPTVNQLAVGKSAHGRELNGHVKRIRYYSRRLTDKQIKTLST